MLEEGSSLWIHCQVCDNQLIKACFSDNKSNSIEVAPQANEECRWHHEPHALGVRYPWQEGNPLGGRALQGKISFPPACNNNLIPSCSGPDHLQGRFPHHSSQGLQQLPENPIFRINFQNPIFRSHNHRSSLCPLSSTPMSTQAARYGDFFSGDIKPTCPCSGVPLHPG